MGTKKTTLQGKPKARPVPQFGGLPIPAAAENLIEEMVAPSTSTPLDPKVRKRMVELACPNSIIIPLAEFGRIFDELMAGARLVMALYRIEEDKHHHPCELKTAHELIAWQAHLELYSACDKLGAAAGYDPQEREP